MVVEPLLLQDLGQLPLLSLALLLLGTLVLEPDLELGLTEAQFPGQVDPPVLCQVPVGLELLAQPLQLVSIEGCPRPLVLLVLLLGLPGSGTTRGPVRISGAENPGWPQLTVGSPNHPRWTGGILFWRLVGGLGEIHWNLNLQPWLLGRS